MPTTSKILGESVISALVEELGYTMVNPLSGGHQGCHLALVQDSTKKLLVVKVGLTEQAINEVKTNISSYQKIANVTPKNFLPTPIKQLVNRSLAYVVLPYAGKSLTDLASEAILVDWQDFWQQIEGAILPTFSDSFATDGVAYYVDVLKTWWKTVAVRSRQSAKITSALSGICAEGRKTTSTLMLCDFTPDNLLSLNGQFKFIDPWPQDTYRGSFLPSLGQFHSLHVDIYGNAVPDSYKDGLKMLVSSIAAKLELASSVAQNQFELGCGLQYALSAYVRQNDENKLSEDFVAKGLAILTGLKDKQL